MSFHYSPKIVTDGLVLYLDAANPKSYPGTGTSWYDLSGNSLHGLLIDTPIYSTDGLGSFVFNGTSNYVNMTSVSTLYTTLECWFKTGHTNGNGVIEAGLVTGRATTYRYNKINKTVSDGNGVMSSSTINDNLWKHLVVQYNANPSDNNFKIHLNGELDYITVVNADYRAPGSKLIGARYYQSVYDLFFNGKISIFKLYNKVLSDAEVKTNYITLKSRFGL